MHVEARGQRASSNYLVKLITCCVKVIHAENAVLYGIQVSKLTNYKQTNNKNTCWPSEDYNVFQAQSGQL